MVPSKHWHTHAEERVYSTFFFFASLWQCVSVNGYARARLYECVPIRTSVCLSVRGVFVGVRL